MNTIQTAISLEEPLYEQVNALADRLKIPLDDLLTIAIQDYVQRHRAHRPKENQDVLAVSEGNPRPKFGSAKGSVKMSDDFDAPLDDFKDYAP